MLQTNSFCLLNIKAEYGINAQKIQKLKSTFMSVVNGNIK